LTLAAFCFFLRHSDARQNAAAPAFAGATVVIKI
jgi:hypothetical protein